MLLGGTVRAVQVGLPELSRRDCPEVIDFRSPKMLNPYFNNTPKRTTQLMQSSYELPAWFFLALGSSPETHSQEKFQYRRVSRDYQSY